SVVSHAIDDSFEAARDVQPALRIDRHRCRIDDPRRECLAGAVRTHAKDGHWNLLSTRAAVGDVQISIAVEHRVIDLVQSGRERAGDANRADRPPTVDVYDVRSAFDAGGNDDDETRRRCECQPSGDGTNANGWRERSVNRKTRSFDRDAAAFDGC